MKLAILAFLLFVAYSVNAQVAPDIISVNINADSFLTGEKAVLTVFKVAAPESQDIGLSIDATMTSPDSEVTSIELRNVTNDIFMAQSAPFSQNGEYVFNFKAYLQDERVIAPLRSLIVDLKKKICELEVLIDLESDPGMRDVLVREKEKLEVDLLIANSQIAGNRQLVQEETIAVTVSGNQAPRSAGQSTRLKELFTDIISQTADHVTMEVCATFSVLDPEDGEDYNWEIDFGDGTQIKFSNLDYNTYALGIPRNFGCVSHSYFGNQRPTIVFKAVDKEGATLTLKDTLDIRTNIHGPLPHLKVSKFKKMTVNKNGKEIPAVEVAFDPINTRIPSNSGIYYFWMFPQGRCGDPAACPQFYYQQTPLEKITHTYTAAGNYFSQFLVRDNLQNTKTIIGYVEIDPSTVPENPTQEYVDALYGPSPIIQVNNSTVYLTDVTKGVEVKFDGSASFDFSGDDSKLKYYWNFSDNFSGSNFSQAKKTSHVFKNPGNYFVSLYVEDEHGNSSVYDYMHVRVVDKTMEEVPPTFLAFRNGNTQEIMFSMLAYMKISPLPNSQFYWRFGDGTGEVSIGTHSPVKTYSEPGIYNVSVTFQDMTGKFVTATKSIDTTNLDPAPQLDEWIRVTPWDFAEVNETVTFDATTSEMQNFQYFWGLEEGKFAIGGAEEAVQSLSYSRKGIKHAILGLTNDSNFSYETSTFVPVGERLLGITGLTLSNPDGNTKVDFTVSVPSTPEEIRRIEIFNWAGGWTFIDNPKDLNVSKVISGTGMVNIIVTDTSGNQSIFFQDPPAPMPQTRERKFPVSDSMMNFIETTDQYGKYLRKQSSL